MILGDKLHPLPAPFDVGRGLGFACRPGASLPAFFSEGDGKRAARHRLSPHVVFSFAVVSPETIGLFLFDKLL